MALLRAAPWLLAAAALLLLVGPALDPALQLYDRDTSHIEGPFKWELWRRLSQHQFPLWATWIEGGTSLLGQMTPGLFHPSTLLYLLPLPFELLFKLQHLGALFAAALGLYLLARSLGAGRYGAAGGALAYTGSGWLVSMAASNLHYALGAAAAPWALHGLRKWLETRRPLWLFWSGWALAWPLLAGDPQGSLFIGMLGVAMALGSETLKPRPAMQAGAPVVDVRAADRTGSNHWHRNLFARSLLRRAGLASAWAICALCLAAPAALPVLQRLRATASTPGAGVPRTLFALPAWRLPGLLIPGAFDETLESTPTGTASTYEELSPRDSPTPFAQGIAFGAPALLLALFAPRRRRRWLLCGALLCVLAAMGARLPVEGLLLHLVPALRWFRYPEKWLAPATLLLSLAAALGADALFGDGTDLLSGDDEKLAQITNHKAAGCSRFAKLALASALLFALAALLLQLCDASVNRWLAASLKSHSPLAAATLLGALRGGLEIEAALVLLLAGCAWLALRVPLSSLRDVQAARWPAALCLCALGASALADSRSLLYTMPLADLRGPLPLAEHLRERAGASEPPIRIDSVLDMSIPSADNVRAAVVLWRTHALAAGYNAFSGVENLASYSSLDDRDFQELRHRAPELSRELFDVQFVIGPASQVRLAEPDGRWEPLPLNLAMRQRAIGPRARLIPCAEALERSEAFAAMSDPGFDPGRLALGRSEDMAALRDLDCSGATRAPAASAPAFSRPSPEQLDVELASPGPALLVVAEHFDPGWSASIDGAPAQPALQIDRAILGVPIAAGHHRVVLRFFPRGLLAGLLIAGLCTALLLAAELLLRIRRKSRRPRQA